MLKKRRSPFHQEVLMSRAIIVPLIAFFLAFSQLAQLTVAPDEELFGKLKLVQEID